jgi:hypothetical protein
MFQEILRILWNSKGEIFAFSVVMRGRLFCHRRFGTVIGSTSMVRYCFRNSMLLATILRYMIAVHTFPFFLLMIHFNITLPSTSRSSKWFLSFTFHLHHIRVYLLTYTCHVPYYFILLDYLR